MKVTCKVCYGKFANRSILMKHKFKEHRTTMRIQSPVGTAKTVVIPPSDPIERIDSFILDVNIAIENEKQKEHDLENQLAEVKDRLNKLYNLQHNFEPTMESVLGKCKAS